MLAHRVRKAAQRRRAGRSSSIPRATSICFPVAGYASAAAASMRSRELAASARGCSAGERGCRPAQLARIVEARSRTMRSAPRRTAAGRASAALVLLGADRAAASRCAPSFARSPRRSPPSPARRSAYLAEGANAAGAALAGAMPHARAGRSGRRARAQRRAAMLATVAQRIRCCSASSREPTSLQPRARCAGTAAGWLRRRVHAVRQPTSCSTLRDVLLPIGTFAETAGTFVNARRPLAELRRRGRRRSASRVRAGTCCACSATCSTCRTSSNSRPSDVRNELERSSSTRSACAAPQCSRRRSRRAPRPHGGRWRSTCRSTRSIALVRRAGRPAATAHGAAGRGVSRPDATSSPTSGRAARDAAVRHRHLAGDRRRARAADSGVAYLTLLGTQAHRLDAGAHRPEPRRSGWRLLQPFADVIKLLFKEIVVPSQREQVSVPARAACCRWCRRSRSGPSCRSRPISSIADIDAGLLYVLALTSLGVYGVILAGWASNSKYAFLGAMRSAAQIVAYEIAMGFALVGVLMAGGSLNLGDDHRRRSRGSSAGNWFFCRCSRCSSCTSSRASPRPTARRSTSPKANRRSSPASTSNTRASRSLCSSSPSTRT